MRCPAGVREPVELRRLSLGSQKNEKWRWPARARPTARAPRSAASARCARAAGRPARPRREARHDAEHPDRDLRGAQQLGLRLVDLDDVAVPGHDPAGAERRREARQREARIRASRSRPRPRSPACRCRPGSRARGRVPERLAELADRVPGSAVTRRRALSIVRDAAQAVGRQHHAVVAITGVKSGPRRPRGCRARPRPPGARADDLGLARRRGDPRRDGLVADPVRPAATVSTRPRRRRASPG